jgi:hypothetical protein
MILLKTIFFLWLGWCIFWVVTKKINAILQITSIKDKKVKELYWAVWWYRKKKILKLLKEGIDINYQIPITEKDVYKQRRTTTLLAWLIMSHSMNCPLTKSMFSFLLRQGADPLIPTIKKLHHLPERLTVMQFAAGTFRSYYLKKILEIAKPSPKKMNMVETGDIPLKQALYGRNYKNFKMLLDYGVYPKWGYYWEEEDGSISQEYDASAFIDLFTGMAIGLNGVYWWLEKGLDWKDEDKDHPGKPYLLWFLENNRDDKGIWATNLVNFTHGIDYVPKIVKFLEEKGIKVNLKLKYKDEEKYITKNGEMVLHVKTKDGKWKPYNKTWQYFINKYWYYNRTLSIIKSTLIGCRHVSTL